MAADQNRPLALGSHHEDTKNTKNTSLEDGLQYHAIDATRPRVGAFIHARAEFPMHFQTTANGAFDEQLEFSR